MSFAALESRVNSAGITALNNCVATVSGNSVLGIFDEAYTDPMGIAGSSPALTVKSADIPALAFGAAVVVNSINYTVASIQPDGTGITRLILQEA